MTNFIAGLLTGEDPNNSTSNRYFKFSMKLEVVFNVFAFSDKSFSSFTCKPLNIRKVDLLYRAKFFSLGLCLSENFTTYPSASFFIVYAWPIPSIAENKLIPATE